MKNYKHAFMLMGMFQWREKIDDAGKRGNVAGAMSLSKQEGMESNDKQKELALEKNRGSSST